MSVIITLFLVALFPVVVAVFLHWLYHVWLDKKFNLPPGPLPLPIIGNALLFVRRPATDVLKDLQDKYGDVITIHIGHSTRAIFFLGNDVIVKVFGDRETSELVADRPKAMSLGRGVKRGILWAGWPEAREPRKFTLRCLKDFGLFGSSSSGKTALHIQEEVVSLCSYVDSVVNQPVNIRERLQECLASCVMIPLHGQRLDFSNERSAELYAGGRLLFDSTFLQTTFSSVLPLIRVIYPDDSVVGEKKMEVVMTNWLRSEIEKREKSFKKDQEICDFVDAYLASRNHDNPADVMEFDVFMRAMVDNFWAGMETTSQSTSWLIFYLAHHPEWQEKLFAEIDSVVPQNSWPGLEHRNHLVLLEAFMHEVYRHCCFIGVVLTHSTSGDFTVFSAGKERFIPANSQIMYVPELPHMDAKYWGDPENFRPERWLTPDNQIISHSHYMPFGFGKRICVGEQAARTLMYLTIAALLQRFTWRLAKFVPLSETYQALNRNPPQNYELIFARRD